MVCRSLFKLNLVILLFLFVTQSGFATGKTIGVQTDLSFLKNININEINNNDALSQQITLAELKEILKKIEEDLGSRIKYIPEKDRAEVLNILVERRAYLEEQIKMLEAKLPTNLQEPIENTLQKVLTSAGVVLAGTLVALGFYLSSYESTTGFNRPSWERLRKNMR